MSYWEGVVERTEKINTVDQFEAAAYRLVSEQVLYAMDTRSRVSYALVERYEREFKHVLAPLGINLQVNRQLRYACALPAHDKSSAATTEQTLIALVLRQIYDESARIGQLSDDGELMCDLVEFDEKYRLATHRELPSGGRLEDLLRTMKRWGIARVSRDEEPAAPDAVDQPFVVVIRPAIADVLGESAMIRLALHAEVAAKDVPQVNAQSADDSDLQGIEP